MRSLDRPQLLELVTRELAAIPPVAVAYVFGSVSTGTDSAESDLDVAVILAQGEYGRASAFWECVRIKNRLEDVSGIPVDVVDMERVAPSLAQQVLLTGKLVLEKDFDRRVSVEEKVRREYWDVLPYRRHYRREVTGLDGE